MEVLTLIFPVFAIIVTGYLFARFEILPMSVAGALTQFVFYTAIPAILFVIIAKEDISSLANWPFLAAYGLPTLVLFLAIFFAAHCWRNLSFGNATMLAFVSIVSNTGIIALPLLHAIFGEKAVVLAALANIVAVFIILIIILLLEVSHSQNVKGVGDLLRPIRNALMNPVILSTILAIAFAASPLSMPNMVEDYLNLFAAALAPCALFAVGMTIKISDVLKTGSTIILTTSVKLLVLPALVLALALALNLSPIVAIAAVISAAVPTAKNAFIISERYHEYEEVTAETVSVTTALSVVTLMGWLVVLGRIYPSAMSLN